MQTCHLNLIIVIFSILSVNQRLSAQTARLDLTLDYAVNVLSLQSASAKIEELNYSNDLLEFENYQRRKLPSISFSLSPVSLNRSIRLLQNPNDGSYSYVNDYSNNSSIGLSVDQKIGFTGGQLSFGSNLNYLNEFSQDRHSFSTTLFTIGYSQQLWGGARLHRMEKEIEEQKNLIAIKQYCREICVIQNEVLGLFMSTAQYRLESELSEINCNINDSLLYVSKMKLDHGNITEYDYKQIELQALNNQYEFDNAAKNYEESKLRLCVFLGIESGDLNIIIPDFNMPPFMNIDLVLDYASNNNTFYTEKQMERMEAEKTLFTTRMNSNLNGNININYGMNQYANNFMNAYRNGNTRGALSVGLEIPIFQWGVNRNNQRIAGNSHNATLLSIEKSTGDFENNIREKVNTYNHSVNLWITAEKAYALSREQYQILVRKFSLEKVSIFELTNAQKEQNEAMERYCAAIKDVYTNYYSLREMALYDFIKGEKLEYVLLKD